MNELIKPAPTLAMLANVSLFAELMERVMGRHRELPGMACFYGPSGFGKTKAAIFAANKWQAHYVEVGSTWTQTKFCRALAIELGLAEKGTVADLVERIIVALKRSRRPLIIDEFDHIVARRYCDLVREIHDQTSAAIIILGEELLPHKLTASERFHNRVLDWTAAQPCDRADARRLAPIFLPGVDIADDLLDRIVADSSGRPRRIAVNLDRVREAAMLEGWTRADAALWGSRPLFKGEPPARRAF
jgi:hypothetical protein